MNFQPSGLRATRVRYVFLGYAAALSLILYLDRICISKSADAMSRELGLDKVQMGWVFSAFTLGYTLFEVPSGAWGDRYGPKRVLCRIVLWWSLFTVLTGCVWKFSLDSGIRFFRPFSDGEIPLLFNGLLLLLLIRFFFGVGEAGAYPNIAKCSAQWFPLRERGLAQGIVATAGRLGGGISAGATLAVTVLVNEYLWKGMGWRAAFWLFGVLGVIWAFFFARWFRNSPGEHPAVNAAELLHITEGKEEKVPSSDHPAGPPWQAMLTSVNLWTFSLMAFCSAFTVYFYFTYFPAYLKERHQLPEGWSWLAGLPLICGAAGCTLGGLGTDYLVRRMGSRRWGRRLMGLAGKGGGALFLLAALQVDDSRAAVAFIALSAFTSDLALAAHWAVCTDVGGRFVGAVFGMVNMMAGVGGALSPILAGHILERISPTNAAGHFDSLLRVKAWDVVVYTFAISLIVCAICWLRIDADESVVG